MLFRETRPALSRTVWILVVVIIVAAIGALEYEVGLGSGGGAKEIDITIHEDNPELQIDHFYPDHVYVPVGQSVSLAILNLDDENRVFVLMQFNVNVTIFAGTTQRVTLTADKLGNFSYVTPVAPPSPVSAGRLAPCLRGFFVVVQNSSMISTTSSSGVGAPGSTYCNPSNPLQNPPGFPPYNGPNPLNQTL